MNANEAHQKEAKLNDAAEWIPAIDLSPKAKQEQQQQR
jgi:hypothetical protein